MVSFFQGDDSVIECVYDDGSTKTKVCTSTNAASGKANARVTCVSTR